MMFEETKVHVIESDEGFSIELIERTKLKYTEGSKTLFVDCEILALSSPFFLALFKDSIQSWAPPNDKELIDDKKRDVIVDNIRKAFAFKGYKIDVGY